MSKIKILILASNPIDTGHLRIDQEIKKIEEGIKLSKYRDSIEIKTQLAVTVDEFRRALLEEKPTIVHFTGHGAGNKPSEYENNSQTRDISFAPKNDNTKQESCLIIENELGTKNFLPPQAVADLISIFKESIKCVVLCACHSHSQAALIAKNIDYAIGMKKAVNDDSAIAFSIAFYDAIGSGETVPFAFDIAVNNIAMKNLEGKDIPQLSIKEGHTNHYKLVSLESKIVEQLSKITLSDFDQKRADVIKKRIEMQMKLQASYEDKLMLEDDPRRQMVYEKEIEKLKATIEKDENELKTLM